MLSGQMMPLGQASLLNMEPTKEGWHQLLVIIWNRFCLRGFLLRFVVQVTYFNW